MPDKKLSVDDILEELQMNRARTERKTAPPSGGMQRIDEVIREILTQKQQAELGEQNRTLTARERTELEQEIEVQTRSLTKQFEKLEKEREPASFSREEIESFALSHGAEAALREKPAPDPAEPVRREAPPPAREEAPAPPEAAEPGPHPLGQHHHPFPPRPYPGLEQKGGEAGEKQRQFDERKELQKANSQHIREQIENINGHFGNFKMDDVSVEDVYLKTEITPSNYKEYKSNRSRKIEGFVLGGKREPDGGAGGEEAGPQEAETEGESSGEQAEAMSAREARRPVPRFEYRYEYTSRSQTDAVWEDLRDLCGSLKTTLAVLGAIGINAFLLSFIRVEEGTVRLLGLLTVTPFLYALVNFLLLLAALLCGFGLFRNAVDCISKGYPTKDLFYAAASVVCLGVNAAFLIWPQALLTGGVHLFTPIAVLLLFFDFVSKYQAARRTLDNFKFVSGGEGKFAVRRVANPAAKSMTMGVVDSEPMLVQNGAASFFENFLAHSFQYDVSDKLMRLALFAALPAAVLLGAAGWFLTKDVFTGLSLLSGTLVSAGGFLGAVLVTLPLHDTSDIVKRFSGMMPDYGSIEEYKDANSLLLEGADLFPGESVILRGIKTFQGKRVDDAILDGASLACAANSALSQMFLTIIGERREILRPVDSIQYEDLMGTSAWVDERRVLLGNRDLMVNHSIAVPRPEHEEGYRAEGGEVIYLAAEGELCAAFIVDFTVEKTVAAMIRLLEKNDLAAVVRTMDASLTPELLARVFSTNPLRFKVLPSRLHAEYAEQCKPQAKLDSMLGNDGTLFGYVVSLAAAKRLHRCIRLGIGIYLAAAVAGTALLAVFLLLGNPGGFGCASALLVQCIFALVYWLYEKNMRL